MRFFSSEMRLQYFTSLLTLAMHLFCRSLLPMRVQNSCLLLSIAWQYNFLSLLLAGSLPGIWVGSRLMHKTPERVIRSILSVLLAWAGSKLVFA